MAAYVEQATYVGDLGSICGIIRTDGIVAGTVKSINAPAAAVLFPVASDTTNAGIPTYSGTQPRSLAVDTVAATVLAKSRDKSIPHSIR